MNEKRGYGYAFLIVRKTENCYHNTGVKIQKKRRKIWKV